MLNLFSPVQPPAMKGYRIIISFTVLCLSAFSLFAQQSKPGIQLKGTASYSLDQLPKDWLAKPKLLQAINDVVPVAIGVLKNSRSCMGCQADYFISVQVDTVFVEESDVIAKAPYQENEHRSRNILDGPASVSAPEANIAYGTPRNEEITRFKFKSYLSVWNKEGKEQARLWITDSENPEIFQVRGRRNTARKSCSAPIIINKGGYLPVEGRFREYSNSWHYYLKGSKLPLPMIMPTDEELDDIIKNKLLLMKKWVGHQ